MRTEPIDLELYILGSGAADGSVVRVLLFLERHSPGLIRRWLEHQEWFWDLIVESRLRRVLARGRARKAKGDTL